MSYCLLSLIMLFANTMRINFVEEDLSGWYIINDGVMGGLSKGNARFTEAGVMFFGEVSLANNGGFTSMRAPFGTYDLSDFSEITIKYRSSGIKMALQLEEDRRFYYPNFKINLPSSEQWVVKTYAMKEIAQYRMGYLTGNMMQVADKSEIIRLGFITDEKRAGDFEFEVAYVEFK